MNGQIWGIAIMLLLLVYFAVELGWGGGDPHHKDHNRPDGWLW